ncbi:MAG: lipid-A-disaccharide synthase [Bacteroidales bacterium]|nr:lipid-A-disaccharide synthase [Bacteroidales bacterium]
MRYYLIAGEASGDLHGSNLLKGLKAEDPEPEFRFWGGDLMSEAAGGVAPVVHYKEGAVMGIAEVLAKAGRLKRNLEYCKQDIAAWQPDVVILIDYPGFNLKIARFCHERGLKVFYYIAPKTWASRSSRNRKIKAWVDKLFVVFPFEVPYFSGQGIPFVYKGNPLLDAVDGHEYRRPCGEPYLAVLPGSRKAEISRMMPICMDVADKLGVKVLVAGAPSADTGEYAPYIGGRSNVDVLFGRTYDILKYADAAIVNSGTASLEAALIGTPQVVCWSSSALTFFVADKIFGVRRRIKFVSLGNLCLGRQVCRELIQGDFNVPAVCEEVRRLLGDEDYRNKMKAGYALIRESLGGSGASRSIARAMIEELK